ncbi:MAG: phosphoribosylanthranilate isomerase [Desulfobacteraceae bacterium]|jgi:phosphoribosylanthranilate isomerase
MSWRSYPQIKICGLTDPEQAVECAKLGADAIGLVFYPKSPRNVSAEQAASITARLPGHVASVGVFVNPEKQFLLETIERCGLSAAQLHGQESPQWVADIGRSTRAGVIKALFAEREPRLSEAGCYDVGAYLVECGKGRLPGGNAMAWNWAIAEEFGRQYPVILAGGLSPENVADAISACLPDAVDASSHLEAGPGRKDLNKVKRFIEQVRQTAPLYQSRKREMTPVLSFTKQ